MSVVFLSDSAKEEANYSNPVDKLNMFGNDDFMSSLDSLQKNSGDLELAPLDDAEWLHEPSSLLVPDVDVCDQQPDFPVVPPTFLGEDEHDQGIILFDGGLAKAEQIAIAPHRPTSSSSSLESWQGPLARIKAEAGIEQSGGMRRVETAASTLTSMGSPDSPAMSRVATSGLRPCLSMPDLTKASLGTPRARGRNSTVATSPPKNLGVDNRTAEERREDRMAALERFREKKRNRTFTKKVRYECRKQLADSRPRVKGRFVKKNEIGLYEKYGEMYRDHLEELGDCVVPSL